MAMGEDLDVEAMLEAAYKGQNNNNALDDAASSERNGHDGSGYESRGSLDGDHGKDREKRDRDRDRDKDREKSRDRDRDKNRDKDRERDRDKDKDRDRDKDHKKSDRDRDRRDRDRDRDRHRDKDRERDKDRHRDRDRDRKRSRSRSRDRHRGRSPRRGFGGGRYGRRMSPSPTSNRKPGPDLTPEERDSRTVFCMQLAARVRPRDLEEFFSSVGKIRDVRLVVDNRTRRHKGVAYIEFFEKDSVPVVRDVRLITCNKTRRFKGVAYVEFFEQKTVALALGLSGEKLLGIPIVVQVTQAEKNRLAAAAAAPAQNAYGRNTTQGPMRLYVGSLHYNISEDMLRGIFEPFGKIEQLVLMMDSETGRSKGYGFVTFRHYEDGKRAMEQLNGFELAGRPMRISYVTEHRTEGYGGGGSLDTDDMDRAGLPLGATGRLALMAKLSQGTGMEIPAAAASTLSLGSVAAAKAAAETAAAQSHVHTAPPISTQCFLLANMFDARTENGPNWDQEIADDVIEECTKHGGALHVFVDKASVQGHVYVKCPTVAAAVASVQALHGRFFAGRVITAAYVPVANYHTLFPEAATATKLLNTSR